MKKVKVTTRVKSKKAQGNKLKGEKLERIKSKSDIKRMMF